MRHLRNDHAHPMSPITPAMFDGVDQWDREEQDLLALAIHDYQQQREREASVMCFLLIH